MHFGSKRKYVGMVYKLYINKPVVRYFQLFSQSPQSEGKALQQHRPFL